jgi:hypothetical protein
LSPLANAQKHSHKREKFKSNAKRFWVQRVDLLLIYLIGTLRGVRGGRLELWRRIFMSRSRGKSLDSFYNRVYRLSCTLDTIPLGPAFRL